MAANRAPTADESANVKQDTVQWPAKAYRTTLVDSDGNSTSGGNVMLIDEASSTVTYIGEATPGTATSAALWKIRKISESGTVDDNCIC
jgi:hypothetical protein